MSNETPKVCKCGAKLEQQAQKIAELEIQNKNMMTMIRNSLCMRAFNFMRDHGGNIDLVKMAQLLPFEYKEIVRFSVQLDGLLDKAMNNE